MDQLKFTLLIILLKLCSNFLNTAPQPWTVNLSKAKGEILILHFRRLYMKKNVFLRLFKGKIWRETYWKIVLPSPSAKQFCPFWGPEKNIKPSWIPPPQKKLFLRSLWCFGKENFDQKLQIFWNWTKKNSPYWQHSVRFRKSPKSAIVYGISLHPNQQHLCLKGYKRIMNITNK